MELQRFWQLRASDPAPDSIQREVITYLLDGLAEEWDVPIEVHLENFGESHVYIRWRTRKAHAGVLRLALEGFFSIRLGQETPKVNASLFLFSGEHKLFPPSADQGYLDLTYQPQQGWRSEGWYMDEFEEFYDKRYSGAVPAYGPIIIPEGPGDSLTPALLRRLFDRPITIMPGEPTRFTSQETLFGALAVGFAGEVRPFDGHPHGLEVTIRLQTGDQPLAAGASARPERVLRVHSSDGITWDYAWKEH